MTPFKPILPCLFILGTLFSGFALGQDNDAVVNPSPATSNSAPPKTTETVEQVKEIPVPELDPEILRQAEADKTRYEQVIDQLEERAAQNVYNAELTEAYLNLAGSLTTLARYDDATAVYDKALQTARISDGLDSLQQIPILEQAMQNNEIRQHWDDVNAMAHLIFHIARRNYPIGDERRIQALNKLGDWEFRAVRDELITGYQAEAMATAELFASEIALLDARDEYADKKYHLATLYLGEAKAKFNVTRQIIKQPYSDYRTGGSSTTVTQTCYPVRLPNGQYQLFCEVVTVPNLDYYIDPSNMKNTNISRQLQDIRRDIVEAYEILQTANEDPERRDTLLAEVQDLTNAYNAFVSGNAL